MPPRCAKERSCSSPRRAPPIARSSCSPTARASSRAPTSRRPRASPATTRSTWWPWDSAPCRARRSPRSRIACRRSTRTTTATSSSHATIRKRSTSWRARRMALPCRRPATARVACAPRSATSGRKRALWTRARCARRGTSSFCGRRCCCCWSTECSPAPRAAACRASRRSPLPVSRSPEPHPRWRRDARSLVPTPTRQPCARRSAPGNARWKRCTAGGLRLPAVTTAPPRCTTSGRHCSPPIRWPERSKRSKGSSAPRTTRSAIACCSTLALPI